MTKTRAIANAVNAISGNGHAVFNDPIAAGRSLKVWGWNNTDYTLASDLLERAGCKVFWVRTRKGATRLHVVE